MIERKEFLKKIYLLAGVISSCALIPASGKAADKEIEIAVVEGENLRLMFRRLFVFLEGLSVLSAGESGLSFFRIPREPGEESPPTLRWWPRPCDFVS